MSATTKASEPNDYDAKIWIAIFIVGAVVGDVTATGGSLWARIMWMRNRPSQMYKCTLSKIGLDNFEGTVEATGKWGPRVLSCSDETPRLNFSSSVHVCVFVLLCWFSKGRFIKNNYVTPVLNSLRVIYLHSYHYTTISSYLHSLSNFVRR